MIKNELFLHNVGIYRKFDQNQSINECARENSP